MPFDYELMQASSDAVERAVAEARSLAGTAQGRALAFELTDTRSGHSLVEMMRFGPAAWQRLIPGHLRSTGSIAPIVSDLIRSEEGRTLALYAAGNEGARVLARNLQGDKWVAPLRSPEAVASDLIDVMVAGNGSRLARYLMDEYHFRGSVCEVASYAETSDGRDFLRMLDRKDVGRRLLTDDGIVGRWRWDLVAAFEASPAGRALGRELAAAKAADPERRALAARMLELAQAYPDGTAIAHRLATAVQEPEPQADPEPAKRWWKRRGSPAPPPAPPLTEEVFFPTIAAAELAGVVSVLAVAMAMAMWFVAGVATRSDVDKPWEPDPDALPFDFGEGPPDPGR